VDFQYSMSSLSSRKRKQKKDEKILARHSSKHHTIKILQPIDPLVNELRRRPVWVHKELEDTDDPFADDFERDVLLVAQ